MPERAGADLNAVITRREEVAPGLIIVQVAPDGWALPEFTPGQYAVLGLPGAAPRVADADPEDPPPHPEKLIRRAYSIASSSVARRYLEFYVTLVRSGALTPRLFMLNIGDRVHLGRKITGMFTLEGVPQECNVILFATGTGIAPYMSMVRTFLADSRRRRFAVVHGARHSWDLGYQSELVTLQRVQPRLYYVPIVSEPDQEPVRWPGRVGCCETVWTDRVIDRQWGFAVTPENTHIFLCGNPAMIQDMLRLLAQDGFREHSKKSPGQVHLEKYW